MEGRRVIRIERTAPGIRVTPARNSTRTHDGEVHILVPSAPRIYVGLGNCSLDTLIISVATGVRSATLLSSMPPRIGDPGCGHEQPPRPLYAAEMRFFVKKT